MRVTGWGGPIAGLLAVGALIWVALTPTRPNVPPPLQSAAAPSAAEVAAYKADADKVLGALHACQDQLSLVNLSLDSADRYTVYSTASNAKALCEGGERAVDLIDYADAGPAADALRSGTRDCSTAIFSRGAGYGKIAKAADNDMKPSDLAAAQGDFSTANELDTSCVNKVGATARAAGLLPPIPVLAPPASPASNAPPAEIASDAPASKPMAEIAELMNLDKICTSGQGSLQETAEVCGRRDDAIYALREKGWCFVKRPGVQGDTEADGEWARCDDGRP